MPNQIYDDYWKFTLANTNFNGSPFISALQAVVTFIDRTVEEPDTPDRYERLQSELRGILDLNAASIRKIINQLIKLGFINTGLRSYNLDTIPYINARTDAQRRLLLSRIVYSNASFARSATVDSDKREINFVIKTIEANNQLSKRELAALMRMEVNNKDEPFATRAKLDRALADPTLAEFEERKYNQISFLWNLLRKLDGITPGDGVITLSTSEADQITDEQESETKGRDKYLQSIYKRQLKEEVVRISGRLECMVNELDYPPQMYIASHIKPFNKSTQREAYDSNNGLLLSLNLDKLFDAGLISFENDGSILISKRLNKHSKEMHDYLARKSLHRKYINNQRKQFLEYHRTKVFN